ncbi:hypothetical protein RUND412_010366 [Rhizina undulata]
MHRLIADDESIVALGSDLHVSLGRYIGFIRSDVVKRSPPEALEELRKELQDSYDKFRRCFVAEEKHEDAEKGVSEVYSSPLIKEKKDKEKEHRQQMSNENINTHGNSPSMTLADKASPISHRTEDKDALDNAHHGRDQGKRVISTQILTLNAVDAGLVPQSGQETIEFNVQISMLEAVAGNRENVSSVADMLDRDKARVFSAQSSPQVFDRALVRFGENTRVHTQAAPKHTSSRNSTAGGENRLPIGWGTGSNYSYTGNPRDYMHRPASCYDYVEFEEPRPLLELSMGFPEEYVPSEYLFLSRVPENCEPRHILSQVTGGKVERLVIIENAEDGSRKKFKCALLCFVDPDVAWRFLEESAMQGFALPDFPHSRVEVTWGDRECKIWRQAVLMAMDPEIEATRVLSIKRVPGRIDSTKLLEDIKCGKRTSFGGLENMAPIYQVERDNGEREYGCTLWFCRLGDAIKAKLQLLMDRDYSDVVITYDKDPCDKEWQGLLTPIRRGYDNSLESQRRDRELQERWKNERIKAMRERERMEQERERQRVLARMKLEKDKSKQEDTGDANSCNESDDDRVVSKEEDRASEQSDGWNSGIPRQQIELEDPSEQSGPESDLQGEEDDEIMRPEDNWGHPGGYKWDVNYIFDNQPEELEAWMCSPGSEFKPTDGPVSSEEAKPANPTVVSEEIKSEHKSIFN